jgi:hypothetical protein
MLTICLLTFAGSCIATQIGLVAIKAIIKSV